MNHLMRDSLSWIFCDIVYLFCFVLLGLGYVDIDAGFV
jgi:hypothetical protein